MYSCKPCGINCGSHHNLQAHLIGKKHRKKNKITKEKCKNIKKNKRNDSRRSNTVDDDVIDLSSSIIDQEYGTPTKTSRYPYCTMLNNSPVPLSSIDGGSTSFMPPYVTPLSSSSGIFKPGHCFNFQREGVCTDTSCNYKHEEKTEDINIMNPPSTSFMPPCVTPLSSSSGIFKPGYCFNFQREGICTDTSCNYKHEEKTEDINIMNTPDDVSIMQSKKRPFEDTGNSSNDICAEFLLCKGVQSNISASTPIKSEQKNPALDLNSVLMSASRARAKIVQLPTTRAKTEVQSTSSFPEIYRNALKRKRNVNLFIQDNLVVWQFSYNLQVISAIKEHIKGRQWNPNIGEKGCWTCPLESLPEAIALYEHMGRTPDTALKERARRIKSIYGGASASDAIKICARFSLEKANDEERLCIDGHNDVSFGSASLTFLYDANVVEALKMLPPKLRSYNPTSRSWTIDLLALPLVLSFFSPLGYLPSNKLKTVADSISNIDEIMHGKINQEISIPSSPIQTTPNLVPSPAKEFSPGYLKVKEEIVVENGQSLSSSQVASEEQLFEEALVAAADESEKIYELEKKFKALIVLFGKNACAIRTINRSNCGEAKIRRLTSSQISYSQRYDDEFGDNDDNDIYDLYPSFGIGDLVSTLVGRASSSMKRKSVSSDCKCGQPWRMTGMTHTCRYFGTFHCSCDNRWTSAYCWEGEMQSCRSCNRESFPVKKDKLDGRIGKSTGAHDASRCAMCKKIGYDCSST